MQAADGYYRIRGRIDDVINVAGHRRGAKEIESCALLVEEIAEAAVVPVSDEFKGKVPKLYVSLIPGFEPSEDIRKRVEDSVIRNIGSEIHISKMCIAQPVPWTQVCLMRRA